VVSVRLKNYFDSSDLEKLYITGTESTPIQMFIAPSPTQTRPQANGTKTAFHPDICRL
jgi:hypothetical protein